MVAPPCITPPPETHVLFSGPRGVGCVCINQKALPQCRSYWSALHSPEFLLQQATTTGGGGRISTSLPPPRHSRCRGSIDSRSSTSYKVRMWPLTSGFSPRQTPQDFNRTKGTPFDAPDIYKHSFRMEYPNSVTHRSSS